MREPIWISADLAIAIHAEQLARFGGPEGLRDRNLLESALARPPNKCAYEGEGLSASAAAYAYGIARNHPFVDGNKRAAFLIMATFLGLNGIDLDVDESLATAVMLDLAAGKIDEDGLTRWLEDSCPALATAGADRPAPDR